MAGQTDSNQNDGASGSQPGSTSNSGGKPNSVDVDALLAALEDPRVASILERKLQSVKDQRFSKLEKETSSVREQLRRLDELQKEGGMSREQAVRWMELEERLNRFEQPVQVNVSAKENVGNVISGSGSVDTDAFLKAVGIDPTDPDVTALYKSGSVTPEQLVTFVTKKKNAPAPVAAQASPVAGGKPNQETLEEQYTAEVNKLPPGSQEVFNLRRKYRKLGLDL